MGIAFGFLAACLSAFSISALPAADEDTLARTSFLRVLGSSPPPGERVNLDPPLAFCFSSASFSASPRLRVKNQSHHPCDPARRGHSRRFDKAQQVIPWVSLLVSSLPVSPPSPSRPFPRPMKTLWLGLLSSAFSALLRHPANA